MNREKQPYHLIRWLIFLILVLLSTPPPFALAAEGELLPPGIVIGDDKGIHVQSDGQYLVEITDVMPGKRWKKEIHLLNAEQDVPYELSFRIFPPDVHGPIDFSKAIHMTLTYEGKEIYSGPAGGVNQKVDLQKVGYSFGRFASGDRGLLVVEFEMDGKYKKEDFFEKSVMENVWEFQAIKKTASEKPTEVSSPLVSKPSRPYPQTGEQWRDALIYTCLGLFLLLILLLVLKKKREKRA